MVVWGASAAHLLHGELSCVINDCYWLGRKIYISVNRPFAAQALLN